MNNRTKRRLLIGCILLPILVVLLVIGLMLYQFNRATHRELTLTEVSEMTGIRFPPSARLVGARYQMWQELEIMARVTVDRNELKHLTMPHLTRKETHADDRMRVTSDVSRRGMRWWRPDDIKSFKLIGGRRSFRNYHWTHLYILVDRSDQPSSTAYIYQVSGDY